MAEISFVERAQAWLEDVIAGPIGYELESRTLHGLQIVRFETGFVRCNFTIPAHASDVNGNWHAGAIATLIDNVGCTAMYTMADRMKVTTNFNISYYSTAKIQEEVEIEAKVIGNKGKLTSVVIEIRRKDNGELVAIGTQWTASNEFRSPQGPQAKLEN